MNAIPFGFLMLIFFMVTTFVAWFFLSKLTSRWINSRTNDSGDIRRADRATGIVALIGAVMSLSLTGLLVYHFASFLTFSN